jgi:hypothetical protein
VPVNVYVVVINDRHADLDVEVYTKPEIAIERARSWAKQAINPDYPEDYQEQTIPGWLFYAKYSPEDDYVRVHECELKE